MRFSFCLLVSVLAEICLSKPTGVARASYHTSRRLSFLTKKWWSQADLFAAFHQSLRKRKAPRLPFDHLENYVLTKSTQAPVNCNGLAWTRPVPSLGTETSQAHLERTICGQTWLQSEFWWLRRSSISFESRFWWREWPSRQWQQRWMRRTLEPSRISSSILRKRMQLQYLTHRTSGGTKERCSTTRPTSKLSGPTSLLPSKMNPGWFSIGQFSVPRQ